MRMLLILTYIICRNHFQGSGRSQALQGIFGRRDLREDTRRSPKILHSYFVRASVVVFFVHRGDLSRLR